MTLALILIGSLSIGIVSWHYTLGWLSFIALLPLFALARRVYGAKLLLYAWLVGLLSSLLTWAWMLTTHPEVWAGVDGSWALLILVLAWLMSGLVFSTGILPLAVLMARYRVNPSSRSALVFIPAAWVAGEFIRSWIFSLVQLGPGGTVGAHWNFGSFGFAASATPLVALSRYLGLFGLSFVVVAINVLIWQLIVKRSLIPPIGLLAIAMAGVLAWSQYRPNGDAQQIGLLHLAEEDAGFPDMLRQNGSPSRLFVLPEYSFYFSETDRKEDLPKLITEDGLIINAGLEQPRLFTDHHSPITYRNQQSEVVSSQQKTFLIPTGEYLPSWIEWIMRRSGNGLQVERFNQTNRILRGDQSERIVDMGKLRIGTLSCSGVITPNFYQELAKNGANILINTAALDIFSHSPFYYQQNRQIARFQAVANAKPFIQAAKGGPSYIVDGNGRFVAEAATGKSAVLAASVTPGNATTPYSRTGEWVVAASGLLFLAGSGIRLLDRQK